MRGMKLFRLAGMLVLILAPALASAPGAGADEFDHERARKAYEAGEIVSLGTILSAVEREQKGQVVEVELERERGRWVYEVEVLAPDGHVVELVYDAVGGKRLPSTTP